MKNTIRIFFFITLLLIISNNSTLAIELIFPVNPNVFDSQNYVINIGEYSHGYTIHYPINSNKLNLAELSLKPDIVYFISLSFINRDGIKIYSEEIVILWSGDDQVDSDEDGLTDIFEATTLKTNPLKKDTDGDGIPDGEEYATFGPNRSLLDYDEDGVRNITDKDSDGDGIPDGEDSELIRIPSSSFFTKASMEKIKLGEIIHLPPKNKLQERYSGKQISISFNWLANTEPDIDGYSILYGIKSKKYDNYIDVGLPELKGMRLHAEITFNKVVDIDTYYFAIIAYNANGVKSDPSAELKYTIYQKK